MTAESTDVYIENRRLRSENARLREQLAVINERLDLALWELNRTDHAGRNQ